VVYKYLVAVAFIAGLFIDILDATIVNVALPTIGRELRVALARSHREVMRSMPRKRRAERSGGWGAGCCMARTGTPAD
jgi:hypothetical protein